MSNEYTEYDGIAMQEGIGHLKKGQDDLNTELASLKSAIGNGFERWSGDAKDAYKLKQDEWDRSGERMSTIIGRISATMVKIAQGYGDTETAIKKAWT